MSPVAPQVVNVTETAWSQGRVVDGVRKWVMCTQAATVMGANWADPSIPPTVAETIALYNAGPHASNAGTTQAQLRVAVQARYQKLPEYMHSYADALTHLRRGDVLTVAGNYHVLPADLQRWDTPFAANPKAWHEVCVGPIATGDVSDDPLVWWRDPLGKGSYAGEWVNWSTVRDHFALSSGDIQAYGRGAWSMYAFTATGPGGGTAVIDASPNFRFMDLATSRMVPASRPGGTYALGQEGTCVDFGTGAAGAKAHTTFDNGRLVVVLDRNARITPPAVLGGPVPFAIKGVVNPDGSVTFE